MKIPMYKKYAETEPKGVHPISNWGGLEILEFEDGMITYAIACFNFGNGRKGIRRHEIRYDNNGRAYFNKCGVRYYLDEFIMR